MSLTGRPIFTKTQAKKHEANAMQCNDWFLLQEMRAYTVVANYHALCKEKKLAKSVVFVQTMSPVSSWFCVN